MLHLRQDLVAGGEVQHGRQGGRGADGGAGDALLAADQVHGIDHHRLQHRADNMQAPLGGQGGEQARPVQGDVDGTDDQVQGAANRPQGAPVIARHHAMGAQGLSLGALGLVGGEGRDLAPPGAQELEGEMPQAADADHPHPRRRRDAVDQQGGEDRDATAHQGPGGAGVQALRQGQGPGPVAAQAIREAPMAADDGPLALRAQMVLPAQAGGAMHATMRHPADTNALPLA